jgi:type IV secretory pathway VirB2 component (pilin)
MRNQLRKILRGTVAGILVLYYILTIGTYKPSLQLIFALSFYGRNNSQQWKLPLLTIVGSIKG